MFRYPTKTVKYEFNIDEGLLKDFLQYCDDANNIGVKKFNIDWPGIFISKALEHLLDTDAEIKHYYELHPEEVITLQNLKDEV
jgi:hypothetical protein